MRQGPEDPERGASAQGKDGDRQSRRSDRFCQGLMRGSTMARCKTQFAFRNSCGVITQRDSGGQRSIKNSAQLLEGAMAISRGVSGSSRN